MCNTRTIVAVVALAVGPAAFAQLPTVQLPNLPRVDLPTVTQTATDTVNGTLNGVAGRLDVDRLTDLRRLRIRELLRTQRASVERDPAGAPILRAEIVAFSPTEAALESARAAGFTVARERALEGLDARIVVLHAPEDMSTRRALSRLRGLDPNGAYDFNHIYLDSGEIGAESLTLAAPEPTGSAEAQPASSAAGASGMRLGLVDGGVDVAHPVFKEARIHQHGCDDKSVPSPHGTAVASLMVGRSELFHGAAPAAELFAADVYCGLGTGGAVDAVVDGIAWIARLRVPVINVSLVGPRNIALENVVRLVIARGFIVVAAVGNDGPAAKPLYPASYPGVVGVTGVDARQKVLLEACRGPQVDFAAPGADMAAAIMSPSSADSRGRSIATVRGTSPSAAEGASFSAVRGTSFAAPLVAGLLATQLREPDAAASQKAIAQLVAQALDLGSRGLDKTYGNGLVGGSLRVAPVLALVGAPAGTTHH